MTEEIKLPEIAEGTESALVTEILVKEGEHVEAEQAIIAVESDKATMEVPVEKSGTVKKINIKENQEVKVGEAVLTLEVKGENGKKSETEKEAKPSDGNTSRNDEKPQQGSTQNEKEVKEQPDEKKDKDRSQIVKPLMSQKDNSTGTPNAEANKTSDNIGAAPSVRRLARELGISLDEVPVKSKGGRITSDDLTQYVRNLIGDNKSRTKQQSEQPLPDFEQWGSIDSKPLSSLRKRIAESTSDAWTTIPHVTQFGKANASIISDYRKNFKARKNKKISVTAILVKIAGMMLRKYPKFNASVDMHNEEVIFKDYFNISFAVDTPDGLFVPVIKNVEDKSVLEVSEEIDALANKARERSIKPADMQGGNFTISNLGGIGGTNFTPVIYPPQVAILGVAQTQTQLVMKNDDIKQQRFMPFGLSYDHRLIDGADAARFITTFCEAIEHPLMLLE